MAKSKSSFWIWFKKGIALNLLIGILTAFGAVALITSILLNPAISIVALIIGVIVSPIILGWLIEQIDKAKMLN